MSLAPPEAPLARFRRRCLSQDPAAFNTGWEDVLVPYGIARAGRILGDRVLLDWAERWAVHHHEAGCAEEPLSPIVLTGDRRAGYVIGDFCGNWAGPLVHAELHSARPASWLVDEARVISSLALRHAHRFSDGAFAHGGWDLGRRTIWIDTLFYSASVFAATFVLTHDRRFAEEALRQVNRHSAWLQDSVTGLFYHDVEPATGARATAFWARGNGWALLALADVLRHCPRDLPGWTDALASYQRLATGLMLQQHRCGLWRIIFGTDEAHLETSGTAMILAGLACGMRDGWIDSSARRVIIQGWQELQTWIDPHGVLQGAQRPAGIGGWETHKLSSLGECTYATGLFWRLVADLVDAGLVARPQFSF